MGLFLRKWVEVYLGFLTIFNSIETIFNLIVGLL